MDIAEALANNYEQVHRTSNFRDPTTDTLVNQTLNLLEAEPNPPPDQECEAIYTTTEMNLLT